MRCIEKKTAALANACVLQGILDMVSWETTIAIYLAERSIELLNVMFDVNLRAAMTFWAAELDRRYFGLKRIPNV